MLLLLVLQHSFEMHFSVNILQINWNEIMHFRFFKVEFV